MKSWAYDAAGNATGDGIGSFTWDDIGTMRTSLRVGRELHFLYNADDERVALVERISGHNKTTFTLRNIGNALLRIFVDDESSGTQLWSWKEDYVWRGGSLLASLSSTGIKHLALDHLGSPRIISTTPTSPVFTQTFSPFGVGGLTGAGSLMFTAHERDSASLGDSAIGLPDYLHARYYLPTAGRFLSIDPARHGATSRPQTWNGYIYAADNPLTLADKNGAWPTHVIHAHQNAIDVSLPSVTASDRKILRDAQVTADLDQQHQYKHAMSLPGQSRHDAAILANDYLQRELATAIARQNGGSHFMAMFHMGLAIHVAQDATSPAHFGYQPFDPKKGNLSSATVSHVNKSFTIQTIRLSQKAEWHS